MTPMAVWEQFTLTQLLATAEALYTDRRERMRWEGLLHGIDIGKAKAKPTPQDIEPMGGAELRRRLATGGI